jgi:integrase
MQDQQKPRGLKRRGGIWWIDKIVRVGERRIHVCESTGTREIGAATDILATRIQALTQATARLDPTERTFREAAVEYVLSLDDRGKDTHRAELDIRMIDPAIGHLPLSHVHQMTVRPWIAQQQGVRASGTVERALRTVTAILNYAARVLRDGNRPWLSGTVPKLTAPDWGERQPVRLTWDEQDRLVECLPASLVAPVLFAVATGARASEVSTLKWEQHRVVEGLPSLAAWWIPPEVRKSNAKRKTGDQEGRYLICNAMARSVLAGQSKESAWAFPSPTHDGPLYQLSNRSWRQACEKAGLDMRFHDLRHTFGERLATVGCPFDARKTILGHHHSDITAHYSTPGLSRLLEEAEKVVRPGPALTAIVRDCPRLAI